MNSDGPFVFPGEGLVSGADCQPRRTACHSYVAKRSRRMGNRRLRVRGASRGGAIGASGALATAVSTAEVCCLRMAKPNKCSGVNGLAEDCPGIRERDASRLRATRSLTPYFASREETWNFTVRSATFSFAAISLFVKPWRMQSRTSCSRRLTFTPAPRARPAASNSCARSAAASSKDSRGTTSSS